MAQPIEVLSSTKYIPVAELVSLLKFGDEPTSELSAFGWEDEETVFDELATFFPFPRIFNRDWPAVKTCVAELCQNSRLIIIRGITPKGLANVSHFVDSVVSGEAPSGRVVIVLEGFTGTEVTFEDRKHKVGKLEEPDKTYERDTYQIQVSGKRNHKYYVNVALKVLKRRSWYDKLELSGLGNAIPPIVSIAEILKRYQIVEIKDIETSLAELSGERSLHKAKIVVVLNKLADVPQVYPTGVQEC
eukprot:TRINITY_DN16980_c0_g1_i1.p1 TRINITY_DN16980_c0_g1~~TRINITY_DN16980_c0_g1_i1.p1  ORF type:complete len:276 (-),score=63.45 TRINITY_DN16980_c0_g1_i1:93-827(-)